MYTRSLIVLTMALVGASISYAAGVSPIIDARTAAMGNTVTANSLDALAWHNNPAALAILDPTRGAAPYPAPEGKLWTGSDSGWSLIDAPKWNWMAQGTGAFSSHLSEGDTVKNWGLSAAGNDPYRGIGFGAGWGRTTISGTSVSAGTEGGHLEIYPMRATTYGAGFGAQVRSVPGLSWGVGIERYSGTIRVNQTSLTTMDESATMGNLGVLYQVPLLGAEHQPIRVGLTVTDLTDQSGSWGFGWGRRWNAGVAVPITEKATLAIDTLGIGSASREWNSGLEYRLNQCALRIGDSDGTFTFGAGYRPWNNKWFVDYAHGQKDGDKLNLLSLGTSF